MLPPPQPELSTITPYLHAVEQGDGVGVDVGVGVGVGVGGEGEELQNEDEVGVEVDGDEGWPDRRPTPPVAEEPVVALIGATLW